MFAVGLIMAVLSFLGMRTYPESWELFVERVEYRRARRFHWTRYDMMLATNIAGILLMVLSVALWAWHHLP